MITHREIIEYWPNIQALADDMGQKYITVYKWLERGRIPPEHWEMLIKQAKKRKIYLTLEELVRGVAA